MPSRPFIHYLELSFLFQQQPPVGLGFLHFQTVTWQYPPLGTARGPLDQLRLWTERPWQNEPSALSSHYLSDFTALDLAKVLPSTSRRVWLFLRGLATPASRVIQD